MDLRPTHPVMIAVLVLAAMLVGAAVLGVRGDGPMAAASVQTERAARADLLANVNGVEVTRDEGSLPVGSAADVDAGSSVAASETPTTIDTAQTDSGGATTIVERRGGVSCEQPHRIATITRAVRIRATPSADGAIVGTMLAKSPYLGQSMQAWIQAVSADGAWGRVTVPWTRSVRAAGWISLTGFELSTTQHMLVADLSDRSLRVFRGCDELFKSSIAIGRAGSPSPQGRFWVTDRVAVPADQQGSFGTYAFGLSTIQPRTPVGWSGGNQMAVHGTGAPGSIGSAASAGCLRVNERTLERLRPLLAVGTPVVITA